MNLILISENLIFKVNEGAMKGYFDYKNMSGAFETNIYQALVQIQIDVEETIITIININPNCEPITLSAHFSL